MKSPLRRKLNVPELAERKADEPFCLARLLRATMNVCCVSVSVVADLHMYARDESSFICPPQRGGEDNAQLDCNRTRPTPCHVAMKWWTTLLSQQGFRSPKIVDVEHAKAPAGGTSGTGVKG